jgi:hypothetical protein
MELLRRQRLPWTAHLPIRALGSAGFKKLVVTGGSDAMYEVVADRLADLIGAQRETVVGATHRVQDAPSFNSLLQRFVQSTR